MKITLPLIDPSFDDRNLTDEIRKDFIKSCQIYVYRDETEWIDDKEVYPFSLWIEYGEENQKSIMCDIRLHDLELFAHTLLKSIEMFRRDYSDEIKKSMISGDAIQG